jgi:hypothetical protein
MKIAELISGKDDHEEITIEGVLIPVSVLKKLLKEGYVNLNLYTQNKTFHVWGERCTACFTEQALREMA